MLFRSISLENVWSLCGVYVCITVCVRVCLCVCVCACLCVLSGATEDQSFLLVREVSEAEFNMFITVATASRQLGTGMCAWYRRG